MKRQVRLMKITEEIPGIGEFVLDYAAAMIDALRSGGMQGITVGEMKDRIDALDAIETAQKDGEDVVVLSEKQHATVKMAVSQVRFRFVTRAAVEFMEHVDHAPEEE